MSNVRDFHFGRGDFAWCLSLGFLSLVLYSQTLGFNFVAFDDNRILNLHPARYNETSLSNSLRQIFIEDLPREEPLVVRDISWALDARLFGFHNAKGYHRTNILLNALVVGLLFIFLRRSGLSSALAGGTSLAFALAPIHVEPVAWVMGRKDLLAATFMLLALLAQHRELSSDDRKKRVIAYVLVFVCLVLALGSKISALSLWLVLLIHRLCFPYLVGERFPTEGRDWRNDLRRALPPAIPHLAVSVLVFSWYRSSLSEYGVIEQGGPGPFDPAHLWNMMRFLPLVAGQYLTHLFVPSELSAYYSWPHVAIPLTWAEVVTAWALAIGIIGGVLVCLVRRRDLVFYPLMTLGLLAPYSGFFYVGFWHADRYFYLASAGVLALSALLLRDLVSRMPGLRVPIGLLVGSFYLMSGVQSFTGQARWRDNETLWRYEVSRDESSLMAWRALAMHYMLLTTAVSHEVGRPIALMSKDIIHQGLARHAELGLQPTDYTTPEEHQFAQLHYLLGGAETVLGAPPEVRVDHYRRSFEARRDRQTALALSGALAEKAHALPLDEQRTEIEESFNYFLEFMSLSNDDPLARTESQQLLESNFGTRYPYLATRVAQAKQTYFP
ncbi:MAG: hypothetical protein IH885_01325 [Myxococcales bacterium]|nr:hypothetical protein [Myxococcales bacterium]